MVDVILSYSGADRETAQRLATALDQNGLTVEYDIPIPVGARWHEVVTRALGSSRVVLVLWSRHSIESEGIRAVAQLAADQGKLIPALIEAVRIPLGFKGYQHLDLSDWDGTTTDPTFVSLVAAATRFKERERAPREPQPDTPGDSVIIDPSRPYRVLQTARRVKIFIAHASADKPKLRPVVKVLIDQGFRLWIDKPQKIGLSETEESRLAGDRIRIGADWKESIRLAVRKCNAVLAFWSKDAINGRREQFHYEVYMAMMQRKLNQCRIDRVEVEKIGMPYTFDQMADLAQMVPGEYNPELDSLMQDIVERHGPKRWQFWLR